MNAERTVEPAHAAEVSTSRANPLVALLTTNDEGLIIERLHQLEAGEQEARWLDQLLSDPRIRGLPRVHEEAIRTLLEFGHPHALLISPDDLERFRQIRPDDIRAGRIAFGGAMGFLITALVAPAPLTFDPAAMGFGLVCTGWTLSIMIRAMLRIGLTRWSLIRELVFLLIAAVLTLEAGGSTEAVAMLCAVVPVALAGLAGGWKES